jgi:hypothetical protein
MAKPQLLLLLSALALAAGCGGAAPGQPGAGIEAPGAPRILSTEPSQGEVVDATERTIVVAYDRALDPGSVTPQSLRVVSPIGEVFGALRHDAQASTLRYELASELARDTPYTVIVAAGLRASGGTGATLERRIDFSTKPVTHMPAQIIEESGQSTPLALSVTERGFGVFLRREEVRAGDDRLRAFAFDPESALESTTDIDERAPIQVDASRGFRVARGRNAVLVWRRDTAGVLELHGRRFNPTTFTWRDAEPITLFGQGTPSLPRAAVSTNGDAIAVWVETLFLGRQRARMRLFDVREDRWGGDFPADAETAPTIDIDAGMGNDGDTMLVYVRDKGATHEIVGRRRTPQAGFQIPDVIRSSTAEEFHVDAVRFSSNGIVHAVWREATFAAAATSLRHARFVPPGLGGQGWEEPQVLHAVAGEILDVQAEAGDDGSLMAVWRTRDPQGVRLRMRRVAPDGSLGPVEAGFPGDTEVRAVARMDARGDGTVALAWLGRAGTALESQFRAAVYAPQSGTWTRVAVGALRPIDGLDIDVALRPDGNAAVRWSEPDPNGAPGEDQLLAARLDRGAGLGPVTPIVTEAGGKSFPLIDLDGRGRGLMAWLHRVSATVRHSARSSLR